MNHYRGTPVLRMTRWIASPGTAWELNYMQIARYSRFTILFSHFPRFRPSAVPSHVPSVAHDFSRVPRWHGELPTRSPERQTAPSTRRLLGCVARKRELLTGCDVFNGGSAKLSCFRYPIDTIRGTFRRKIDGAFFPKASNDASLGPALF